ncbi:MAG: hypothetical protein HY308_11475 [Gammaproteobacteria bacterium]|nr:hypothetical protein [Gammaproteobacteria bacterium]
MHDPEKIAAGVWIDHSKAVIVTLTTDNEQIDIIESNVQWQRRRNGSIVSRRREPRPADDQRTRDFVGHLNIYYDEVIAKLHDADSVLIFGPGLAKGEFERRLDRNKIRGQIEEVEAVDKMTPRQIAAKVRHHFHR